MDESSAQTHYLADALDQFATMRRLAERALAQVDDEQFFARLDPEANSLAILVKHVAGNLHSRWRDFLTTDGEKPDRDRDSEFVIVPGETRATLMARWDMGWATLCAALEPLAGTDLMRTVTIRGEQHTVIRAVNRQLTHYSYHVGQIVLLAKHARRAEWSTLSIPRGGSAEYNRDKRAVTDTGTSDGGS